MNVNKIVDMLNSDTQVDFGFNLLNNLTISKTDKENILKQANFSLYNEKEEKDLGGMLQINYLNKTYKIINNVFIKDRVKQTQYYKIKNQYADIEFEFNEASYKKL